MVLTYGSMRRHGLLNRASASNRSPGRPMELTLRIPEGEFEGRRTMAIPCNQYGNEKALVFDRKAFAEEKGRK